MENYDLIEKFKQILLTALDKQTKSLAAEKEKASAIRELRGIVTLNGDYTIILNMETSDIMKYLKYLDLPYTEKEIDTARYIISTPAFKSSPSRYKTAVEIFENIYAKFTALSHKGINEYAMHDYQVFIDMINNVLANIVNGKIVGSVDNLDFMDTLLSFGYLDKFSDEEILTLMTLFVEADLADLKEKEQLETEEIIQGQLDEIDNNDFVVDVTPEEVFEYSAQKDDVVAVPEVKEDAVKETVVDVHENVRRVEISSENLNFLKDITEILKSKIDSLSEIEKNSLVVNLGNAFQKGELSLQEIRDMKLYGRHYIYFLKYVMSYYVSEINEFLNFEVDDSTITDVTSIINEYFKILKTVFNEYNNVMIEEEKSYDIEEEPSNEEEIDSSLPLIFYIGASNTSEMEKSLKDIPESYYDEVVRLLAKIGVDNQSDGYLKSNKIFYLQSSNIALTYRVYKRHVIILRAILLGELNKKKSDNSLNIDTSRVERIIRENGKSYREMIAKNAEIIKVITEKLGVGNGYGVN